MFGLGNIPGEAGGRRECRASVISESDLLPDVSAAKHPLDLAPACLSSHAVLHRVAFHVDHTLPVAARVQRCCFDGTVGVRTTVLPNSIETQ